MTKTAKFTTHIRADVPDEYVGAVQRIFAGMRGVTNVSAQPNGTPRSKGDAPSRQNDSTKTDVILAVVRGASGPIELAKICEKVEKAGFSAQGLGGFMSKLVEADLITRVERGVYSAQKALPAPTRKKRA